MVFARGWGKKGVGVSVSRVQSSVGEGEKVLEMGGRDACTIM